jgi:hypothetical protein
VKAKNQMRWIAGAFLLLGTLNARAFDTFMKPTPEELSMKALPGYPGVSAVVLYREEVTQDDLHVVQHYERIKVLTEEGKKYANVELPFVTTTQDGDYGSNDKTLGQIQARTIHADGTIVPFTGKPYLKVIEKQVGVKVQAKVFTLPDVEVGSILEYRYATRTGEHSFESPDWYIQGDLYVKLAHYVWHPTTKELVDYKERPINAISWFPILPPGVRMEHNTLPQTSSVNSGQQTYELTVKDIPPIVEEEFMPPVASYTYRVLFNFTAFHDSAEFWKEEGKERVKEMNSFANSKELRGATQEAVAGETTDEGRLKKIYALVMSLENTDFTREHERSEDKAEGMGKIKNAGDILARKRGTPTQLTQLFVGMARAAGMKAYFMFVPDRSESLFTPQWLNFRQLDDVIAIVKVEGKEVYFDPGWRYAAYGHLGWQHTFVRGMRETDTGTEFVDTDGDDYKVNRTVRVANLTMDEKGQITGKINLTFMGSTAVRWRHLALRGDEESLKKELTEYLEKMVPSTLEVKVTKIDDLATYEKPLTVDYEVNGRLGAPTGKRLVMPADLFEAQSTATFPDEKREQAVYFHFPHYGQDAVRINFPKGFDVEAIPDTAKFMFPSEAYSLGVTNNATSFTARREHIQNEIIVLTKDYDALRKFTMNYESKDHESVVLKVLPAGTASASN